MNMKLMSIGALCIAAALTCVEPALAWNLSKGPLCKCFKSPCICAQELPFNEDLFWDGKFEDRPFPGQFCSDKDFWFFPKKVEELRSLEQREEFSDLSPAPCSLLPAPLQSSSKIFA